MDSTHTAAARSRLWHQDEARSALARYLDCAVADQDHVADAGTADAGAVQQHRDAAGARRMLDSHGPFQVPPMVLTAAVNHWQARLDEAEARLRDASWASEQNGWRIEKVTALVAVTALVEVDALRGLDRASTG